MIDKKITYIDSDGNKNSGIVVDKIKVASINHDVSFDNYVVKSLKIIEGDAYATSICDIISPFQIREIIIYDVI